MAKNHYFSDITELFLKAKEEENINIDPHRKAAAREMLVYKINELKGADTGAPASRKSFFEKWRYQLVGVPASLFALVLIVFAATNLKFTMPKEDFTPTVDTEPTEIVQIIQEAPLVEEDKPVVRTTKREVQDILVLDFSKAGEPPTRTLKKLPQTTSEPTAIVSSRPETHEEPVVESEEIEPSYTSPIFIVYTEEDTTDPESETYEEILPEEDTTEPEEEPEESLEQDIPQTDEEPQEQPEPDEQSDAEPTTSPEEEDPQEVVTDATYSLASENILDRKDAIKEQYTEKAQKFTEIIEDGEHSYSIYYYQNSKIVKKSTFNKERILKLVESSRPSLVSVYYITEEEVVVEVNKNGTTKWYLFENVKGGWTIQKYEKQTFKSMVE